MLTKEQFTKHLTRLVELKKEQEKVEYVMIKSKLNDSQDCCLLGMNWYEDLTVNLLANSMDDRYGYISYWLYELSCGKDYKKGCITDEDDKEMKMKTISDLYNCIVNQNRS